MMRLESARDFPESKLQSRPYKKRVGSGRVGPNRPPHYHGAIIIAKSVYLLPSLLHDITVAAGSRMALWHTHAGSKRELRPPHEPRCSGSGPPTQQVNRTRQSSGGKHLEVDKNKTSSKHIYSTKSKTFTFKMHKLRVRPYITYIYIIVFNFLWGLGGGPSFTKMYDGERGGGAMICVRKTGFLP